MCKILVVPGIPKGKEKKAWQFIQKMSEHMSIGNMDGLGYAAFDSDGKMFSERWHYNKEAFKSRKEYRDETNILLEKFSNFLQAPKKYEARGLINFEHTKSVILHTRSATSGREFNNTHPFIRDNTALIHNGVIRNIYKEDNVISSCDSEKILTKFLEHKVSSEPENINKVGKLLQGYYACGVLSYDKDHNPIVDIFKEEVSNLHAAYINELDMLIITTSLLDVKETIKEFKWSVSSVFDITPGRMIRINALTGDVICGITFDTDYEYETTHTHSDYYMQGGRGGHYHKNSGIIANRKPVSNILTNNQISEISEGVHEILTAVKGDEFVSTDDDKTVFMKQIPPIKK